MARTFNVSFNISGSLDGSLQAALANAANAMKGLGNAARGASANAKASMSGLQGLASSLNALQNAATRYKALQESLRQVAPDFGKAGQSLESAKAKFDADSRAVDNLRQKLSSLNQELSKARQKKLVQSGGVKAAVEDLKSLKRAYAEAKQAGDQMRMSTLAQQISLTEKALARQRQTAQEAARAYAELSNKIKQTKADLKAAESAAKDSGKGLNRARQDAERLKQSYQNQLLALNQLKASLSAAGFNVSSFAASEERLQADINRVNAALERQAALLRAQQQSAQASQDMFNAYNNFQNALSTAETIASPFKASAEVAIDFEHAMSRVKALTQSQNIREGRLDQVDAEMKKLTQQARDLGATTMFTSTQAAQAMGYLGMAGWKTQQIYATMPGMLDLAAAAGADLAQTADIVSDNMTAMGVPVNQAAHFMDVYAYALTNSNARLTDFGETMKYAAPVAKAFGSSLDETAAMVMMMANAGIKGSMAGTSLRMGLLRLAGPPKTATKEMAKLGLSLSDAQAGALEAAAVIKGLGIDLEGASTPGEKMTRVLMQLHEKTKGLSQDEKLAAFKGIFGVNAETGWLALFDQGPEVFLKYVAGLRNADGYSKQVAATMLDDTKGALIMLESAWDAFKERIGKALLPTIRSTAEAITPLVSSFAQWIEEHPAVVQACAAIAAGLATIVVAAAAVKLAFAGWAFITSTIQLVQTSLAAMGSGAMLGGLIGRLAALRAMLFGVGGAATLGGWGVMFGAIAAKATLAATAIRGFFASLTLGSIGSGIISVLSSIGTAIAGVAKAAFAFAFSPVGVALMALALAGLYCYQNWDKVSAVLSNLASTITGALSSAIATIQPAIQNLMTAFENLGNALGSSGILSTLGMLVTGILSTIASVVTGALSTVINVVATIISTIANMLSGIVNLIANVLQGKWSSVWDSAYSVAVAALEGIYNVASNIFDGILSTVRMIRDAWASLRGEKISVPHGDNLHGDGGDSSEVQQSAPAQVPVQPAPVQVPVQPSTPTPTAAEAAQLDTTAAQSALDAVGQSAQTASTNMQGLNQAQETLSQFPASLEPTRTALAEFPASLEPAKTTLSEFPTALQPAQDGLNQLGTTLPTVVTSAQNLSTALQTDTAGLQNHTSALSANSAALQANIGALQAFGAACNGAVGGVTALGSAASSAAGSVSGLGSAAQSACSQLEAAGAQAAARVNAAAASVGKPAANYEGGIYRKGAFLTTFAERSAEAAIPLDKSRRAQDLWTQAGQILGMLPADEPIHYEGTRNLDETEFPKGKSLPRRESQRVGRPHRETSTKPRATSAKLPNLPYLFTQTQPRYYDSLTNVFGGNSTTSLIENLIKTTTATSNYSIKNLPSIMTQTQPTTYNINLAGDMPNEIITTHGSDGLIGSLLGQIIPQPITESAPTINLTVNVTVNGGGGTVESDVRRGVESALPAVEDWSRRYSEHLREQRRRSYA